MPHYVYILYSDKHDKFYVGESADVHTRLLLSVNAAWLTLSYPRQRPSEQIGSINTAILYPNQPVLMARLYRKHSEHAVKEFGTLGFVGAKKLDRVVTHVIEYTRTTINRSEGITSEQIVGHRDSKSVTWINIAGLHDVEYIKEVGKALHIHPMVIDKITNTGDRISFEDYEDYLVLSTKLLHLNREDLTIEAEHALFILYDNLLISFQENLRDSFGPIRERLENEVSRIRKMNTDYLLFALVRTIVNDYAVAAEVIGEKIENLENSIIADSSSSLLEELHEYNGEISYLNRLVRPAKEAISSLCRSDSELINHEKSQYIINHLLENIYGVADACENYRMMIHDQLSIYHTNVANKLNEMFRILTIFSVIFVPLTFVAGIYGMNFEYIPELSFRQGYFVVWGVMIAIAVVMLLFFKRKKWL